MLGLIKHLNRKCCLCQWSSYGFISINNLQQLYKDHFHCLPVHKRKQLITFVISDCIHTFSYKCASWYSKSCKDCPERLTPNCDGSNVTGIHSIGQGHHDVFVVEAPSLKCTWVVPSNPKESCIKFGYYSKLYVSRHIIRLSALVFVHKHPF